MRKNDKYVNLTILVSGIYVAAFFYGRSFVIFEKSKAPAVLYSVIDDC